MVLLFNFVQIAYWLALATWFGAVLFVAMAAPIILRTVREHNPLLPTVLSVNLEGQHGTLLSQTIVGQLMVPLQRLGLTCAAVLLLALIAQWILLKPSSGAILEPAIRTSLYIAA